MSTPAQKANLARIRDNQRRSRARRREYLQDLEQRLRLCELQGIEATTEVQVAARRVAEENRQLRQLLNKHGFSDEYIGRFLQAGIAGAPDMNRGGAFTTGDPGMAVHTLRQAMASRRPASLDANVPFSVTGQVMSDSSISSTPSVSSSAPWDALPAESAYGHNPGMHMQAAAMAAQPSQQQYSATLFMGNQSRGPDAYLNPSPQMNSLASTSGMGQSMQQQDRGHMQYSNSLNSYQTGDDGGYGDTSSGGWAG
ncbi:hypothetical protein PWT90_00839 [Aphanocladium album]|nr:hypothetical protein PWT90_00839 [Aphanocladium album]